MTPPNENWQVGEQALCVDDEWVDSTNSGMDLPSDPRKGGIYVVDGVDPATIQWGKIGLSFAGFPRWWYEASGFRKIRPLTDEEQRQAREEMGEPEVVS